MENELLIKFGGENTIKVETLTSFLDSYAYIFHRINTEIGYQPEDLVIHVSPPIEGSFKIKISPKYENLALKTLGGVVTGTMVGVLIAWMSPSSSISKDDIDELITKHAHLIPSDNAKYINNIYQDVNVKQIINQTFIVVGKDPNVDSLEIRKDNYEVLSVPRKDFSKYIKNDVVENGSKKEEERKENAVLIIKTIHFEGKSKWGFIHNGNSFKATIKDQDFLRKLKDEPFKKGDKLSVKLQGSV